MDEKAVLQLVVEVKDALANVEQLRAGYDTAIKDMQAATKAGLDPASAQFQYLQDRVKQTGLAVVSATGGARDAMKQLAHETGQSVRAVKDLDASIAIVRAQVDGLNSGSLQKGSNALAVFGGAADKVVSRLKSFGIGVIVGAITSELIPALEKGRDAFVKFAAETVVGGRDLDLFGDKIRQHAEAQAEVAARSIRIEADLLRAQTGTRLSLDEIVLALDKRNRALAAAEAAYAKANALAEDAIQKGAAEAAHRRALTDATREFTDTLRDANAARERELDLMRRADAAFDEATSRRDGLLDSIVGNSADLEARTAALQDVVETVKESGKVHKEVAENITAELKKLTAEYERFGRPLPVALRELRKEFPFLTDEQEKAAAAAKKLADAQREVATATKQATQAAREAVDAFGRKVDPEAAKQEVERLRERKAALEEEERSGRASLEALNELLAVKGELFEAEGKLAEALRLSTEVRWQRVEADRAAAEASRQAAVAAGADAAQQAAALNQGRQRDNVTDPEAARQQVAALSKELDDLASKQEKTADDHRRMGEIYAQLAGSQREVVIAEREVADAAADMTTPLVSAAEASRRFNTENQQSVETLAALATGAKETSLHLDQTADGAAILADGARQIRTELPQAGRAIGEVSTITKDATAAVAGLAANQRQFNAEAGAMAAAAEEAGMKAGTMGQRVDKLSEHVEQLQQKLESLTAKMGETFDVDSVEAWAAKVETRAIPVALQLKACLDGIE